MAITFGADLGGAGTGSTTDASITNLSVTGSNAIIWYWIETDSQGVTVSTLNYDDGAGGGSQAFTQFGTYKDTINDGGTGRFSFWYLVGPTAGSGRRILGTLSGNSPKQYCAAFWNGVAQTSTLTTVTQGVDTATPLADTDTSDTNGSWQISGTGTLSGQPISITSGGIIRSNRLNNGSVYLDCISDSNADVNSGNSNTINYAWVAGHDMAYISAMMRPVASAPATSRSGSGSLLTMGVGN